MTWMISGYPHDFGKNLQVLQEAIKTEITEVFEKACQRTIFKQMPLGPWICHTRHEALRTFFFGHVCFFLCLNMSEHGVIPELYWWIVIFLIKMMVSWGFLAALNRNPVPISGAVAAHIRSLQGLEKSQYISSHIIVNHYILSYISIYYCILLIIIIYY